MASVLLWGTPGTAEVTVPPGWCLSACSFSQGRLPHCQWLVAPAHSTSAELQLLSSRCAFRVPEPRWGAAGALRVVQSSPNSEDSSTPGTFGSGFCVNLRLPSPSPKQTPSPKVMLISSQVATFLKKPFSLQNPG